MNMTKVRFHGLETHFSSPPAKWMNRQTLESLGWGYHLYSNEAWVSIPGYIY